MSLIQLLVVIAVAGVVLWLVDSYIPMNATIKTILNIVVIIAVLIMVLNAFGVLDYMPNLRVMGR